MNVVVSAVMNALVVCWQEEHLIGLRNPLRSEVVPPPPPEGQAVRCCSVGLPQRSFQHWSEWMVFSSADCVCKATLQCLAAPHWYRSATSTS